MNSDSSTERGEGGVRPAAYGFMNMMSGALSPSSVSCVNAGTTWPAKFDNIEREGFVKGLNCNP